MSTTVLCNNLVSSRCRSRSRLFVDFRDHYSQDTPANTRVRSVEEISGEPSKPLRELIQRFNESPAFDRQPMGSYEY
jgi:hypothetical protein